MGRARERRWQSLQPAGKRPGCLHKAVAAGVVLSWSAETVGLEPCLGGSQGRPSPLANFSRADFLGGDTRPAILWGRCFFE